MANQSFSLTKLYSSGVYLHSRGFHNDETRKSWSEKLLNWVEEVECCLCLTAPGLLLNTFEKNNLVSILSVFSSNNPMKKIDYKEAFPVFNFPSGSYEIEFMEDVKHFYIKLIMLDRYIKIEIEPKDDAGLVI